MAKARSKTPRRKKEGGDPGKKRRRMRKSVATRKKAADARPSRDEVDTVKYKKGSAGDRTRRGAP